VVQLITDLLSLVSTIDGSETPINRQTALYSLKLITRILAEKGPPIFTKVCHIVADMTFVCLYQGLYRSWKTWKVMEFCFLAFQAWKVMEVCVELLKVMENFITIKNYESIFIVYRDRQKFQ